MQNGCRDGFARRARVAKAKTEGALVNCRARAWHGAVLLLAILLLATGVPLAAQSRVNGPGIPANPPPATVASSAPRPGDTGGLALEAQTWLIDLIKINTSNPPGGEEPAAKYVASVLQKEGLNPEILEMGPGRSAVVARLRSAAMAEPSKALLLVAHLDVVPADKTHWSVDPFGGVVKDGYIYGRGAIDDKGMLAANLAAFIALKRSAVRLNRDVIFLATADEETSGEASIANLANKYWDKFAAGFAINEGGNVFVVNGKVQYIGLQASEKVSMNINVTARGTSGHASQPTKDNAVVHLATAVGKIGAYAAPVRFTTIVRRYFEGLAPLEDDEVGKWLRSLDTPDRGEHAQHVISDDSPLWNAMMRDTIAPTILNAGTARNVIPGEAHANLNVRLLPGDTINTVLLDLTKLVNDPAIHFDVLPTTSLAAPDSSLETEFYATIARVATREFGGAPTLPFQSTWATDSSTLRLRNVQAYGLVPFPLNDEDLKRMHGDDERLSIASFTKGVDVLAKIVAEFAAAH
jgi:acetylornithine deacetylase/succinyl-diaminopimelate desuccinylase-like protein